MRRAETRFLPCSCAILRRAVRPPLSAWTSRLDEVEMLPPRTYGTTTRNRHISGLPSKGGRSHTQRAPALSVAVKRCCVKASRVADLRKLFAVAAALRPWQTANRLPTKEHPHHELPTRHESAAHHIGCARHVFDLGRRPARPAAPGMALGAAKHAAEARKARRCLCFQWCT